MARAESKSLAANIRAAFGGELIQVPLSLALFAGLAWQLDETDFGYWVAITSTGMIVGTFANLGSQELLVREVARGAKFAGEWGLMLVTQAIGASAGAVVIVLVRPLFFSQVSLATTMLIALTNLYFFWTVEGCVRCGQAIRVLGVGARARLGFATSRIIGIVLFVVLGSGDLDSYARIAFPFSLLGAIVAVWSVAHSTATRPEPRFPRRERILDGIPFVGTAGAQDFLASIDRPLLSGFGFVADAGNYGIADRAVRLATLPTLAIVRATAADFFETGYTDPAATFELARKYAKPTVAYGVVAAIGILAGSYAAAPLVPERFEPVLPMLAVLSIIPFVQALQMFPANVLTGTDNQSTRMRLYMVAAALNVVANLLLIPEYGWRGAAIATIIAEFFLAGLLWFSAYRVASGRSS